MDYSISLCFENLKFKLSTIYDNREADNISRIIFEDVFSILNPQSSSTFFDSKNQKLLNYIIDELIQHKPWQYIVGKADFYGLKFNVDKSVLIPRPETEELVNVIIDRHKGQTLDILDIGTGSGCIAVCLDYYLKNVNVTGVDICSDALKVAHKNAKEHSTLTQFKQINILDFKSTKKMPIYDIIVSNPPYIKFEERQSMAKHVINFEPELALFVNDNDPLLYYRTIIDFALNHLNQDNGWLYFETSTFYATQVLNLIKDKGFVNCLLLKDMNGNNRIVLGSIKI
ncbi:peptide chain release factor N(5)-glutamine methyltransferase [Aureispira]|nr:peptide chain release factor N(5)-glutamine methyltransferase [Aureispira sp.]